MRDDRAVRRRVRDAGEHEAVVHLRVVEERLVALVDLARGDLARARRAGARAARVREVHALLLGLVEDVHVVGALDGRLGAVLDERHGVVELERRARLRCGEP